MIKGLSNKRRFPRVGKLKIGIKNEKGIPKSIDYFRADGKYAQLFHQVYGEKPSQVEIVLPPVQDIDDAVEHYYKYYKSDGIYCRGDGEIAYRANGGEMEEIECNENCPYRDKKCMPYLTLKFMVPKVPVIGLWHLTSKSVNSTLNALSGIDLVTSLAGKAYGIPLQLSVKFEHSSVSGNSNRFPVLTITPIATTQQLVEISDKSGIERFQFFQTQDIKQIEAPKKMDKIEQIEKLEAQIKDQEKVIDMKSEKFGGTTKECLENADEDLVKRYINWLNQMIEAGK